MKNLSFKKQIGIITLSLVTSVTAFTQPKPASIFTDNMVLQQQSDVAVWGTDKPGAKVQITTSWNGKKYAVVTDKDGKWLTKVSTPKAGGPYDVTISDGKQTKLSNVLIGEVWLCAGQSNMEEPMKGFKGSPVANSNDAILRSKNKNIRVITVPRASTTEPQTEFKAQWAEASPSSIADFSATGYYFGKLVNEITNVPVGLICVSYGGSCVQAWMSKETSCAFEKTQIPQKGDSIKVPNRTPTTLFNGMLYPVIGYGIKGCIWYQGETNYQEPDKYPDMLKTMVTDWRKRWNVGEFPFYFTQIAPYDYFLLTPNDKSEKNNSAFIRAAQLKAKSMIPNSGIAILLDAGVENNIHPYDKKTPGERLAYQALAKTYGVNGFGFDSPEVDQMNVKDSIVTLSLKNIPNGITSYDKEVTLFEIAGSDNIFYPAKAVLGRKSVTLSTPKVKNPVSVRYAFRNYVEAQVFNTEGLPMGTFMMTLGK
jgi:Domain of unknown function (DUF303).